MKLDKNYMISDFKNVGSIVLYSDASNNLYVKKEDVGSVEKAITKDVIMSLVEYTRVFVEDVNEVINMITGFDENGNWNVPGGSQPSPGPTPGAGVCMLYADASGNIYKTYEESTTPGSTPMTKAEIRVKVINYATYVTNSDSTVKMVIGLTADNDPIFYEASPAPTPAEASVAHLYTSDFTNVYKEAAKTTLVTLAELKELVASVTVIVHNVNASELVDTSRILTGFASDDTAQYVKNVEGGSGGASIMHVYTSDDFYGCDFPFHSEDWETEYTADDLRAAMKEKVVLVHRDGLPDWIQLLVGIYNNGKPIFAEVVDAEKMKVYRLWTKDWVTLYGPNDSTCKTALDNKTQVKKYTINNAICLVRNRTNLNTGIDEYRMLVTVDNSGNLVYKQDSGSGSVTHKLYTRDWENFYDATTFTTAHKVEVSTINGYYNNGDVVLAQQLPESGTTVQLVRTMVGVNSTTNAPVFVDIAGHSSERIIYVRNNMWNTNKAFYTDKEHSSTAYMVAYWDLRDWIKDGPIRVDRIETTGGPTVETRWMVGLIPNSATASFDSKDVYIYGNTSKDIKEIITRNDDWTSDFYDMNGASLSELQVKALADEYNLICYYQAYSDVSKSWWFSVDSRGEHARFIRHINITGQEGLIYIPAIIDTPSPEPEPTPSIEIKTYYTNNYGAFRDKSSGGNVVNVSTIIAEWEKGTKVLVKNIDTSSEYNGELLEVTGSTHAANGSKILTFSKFTNLLQLFTTDFTNFYTDYQRTNKITIDATLYNLWSNPTRPDQGMRIVCAQYDSSTNALVKAREVLGFDVSSGKYTMKFLS